MVIGKTTAPANTHRFRKTKYLSKRFDYEKNMDLITR